MPITRSTRTKAVLNAKGSKSQHEDRGYHGLCTTCNYAPECINAKNSEDPIIFCEMFDDFTEPVQAEKLKPQAGTAPAKNEISEFKGLCVNCEERNTCKFPKPEGGIWHCEEYR